MSRWTEQGEQLVNQVASRYGVSNGAVAMMLDSVLRGNGTMAQFNINELGGGGQWMRGGMTMVGDMFNYSLKSKVDGICGDLSSAIVDQRMQVVPPPPPIPANQAGAGQSGVVQSQYGWNQWWPAELGSPSTSGAQNQYKYAYFPTTRRLALSDGYNVTVYDTLDHNIGGVSQQQGGVAGVSFNSQYGTVDLRTLPLVSGPALGASIPTPTPVNSQMNFQQANAPEIVPPIVPAPIQSKPGISTTNVAMPSSSDEIVSLIERLAKLREAGAITDEEFNSKKIELLGRL